MDGLTYGAHRSAVAAGRYLRVVNYHNTLRGDRGSLRSSLASYAQDFVPLTLADLDRFFSQGGRPDDGPDDRPGFIPVFYEGFRNGYDVAAAVCDELGITGWFAVCTGFVDCPPAQQEVFARSHWLDLAPEELDGRRLAMTWDEVADLAGRHVVFPHTGSHVGIADIGTDEDLHREVVVPKQRLDAVTGQDSPAFAWLWGAPLGVSARHDAALVAAGYRYVFSNTMIQRVGLT